MDRKSKILFITMIVLIAVSVSATFYKTVILQDFDVTGVWIEFPTEDTSYVWFVYDDIEYELELEENDLEVIKLSIASSIGVEVNELDTDFVSYVESSYEEALTLAE